MPAEAPRPAVVLLSGGLDSATVLAVARREGYRCHALTIAYGQRHAVELAAARRVAAALGAAEHRTMTLDLSSFSASALTGNVPVPKDRAANEMASGIPVTYVPARNTLFLAFVSQGLVIVLASTLAIALQRDFRGKWFVRLLILLPWVAPVSLGTIGWLWMFDPIYSVLTWVLHALHLLNPRDRIAWLGRPNLAMGSIIAVQIWRTLPLATVILLGGLSSIPQDIHDQAEIDGARFWRHLLQITVPLVLPIQLVAVLFGFVFATTDMIVVWVLTRGGPYDTTQVLASMAFFRGIDGGDLAGGASIALFLFPVLAVAAVLLLRLARRTEVT